MSSLDDRLLLAKLKRKRIMLSRRIDNTMNPKTIAKIEAEAEPLLRDIQALENRMGTLNRTRGAVYARASRMI